MRHRHDAQVDVDRLVGRRGMHHRHGGGRDRRRGRGAGGARRGPRLAQDRGHLAVTDDGLPLMGLPQPFGDRAAAAFVRVGLSVGQHLRTERDADRRQTRVLGRPRTFTQQPRRAPVRVARRPVVVGPAAHVRLAGGCSHGVACGHRAKQ